MPNSLIEAMSIGLPFVASNIEAIKEVLPEQFYDFLVGPNDTERAKVLLSSLADDSSLFPSRNLSKWTLQEYQASKQFEYFRRELDFLE